MHRYFRHWRIWWRMRPRWRNRHQVPVVVPTGALTAKQIAAGAIKANTIASAAITAKKLGA